MLEFFPYNLKSSNSWSFLDELCGFTYFDSVKNITFELIVLLIEKSKKNLNFQKPRLDQWKNSSSKDNNNKCPSAKFDFQKKRPHSRLTSIEK